jgi:hypothetical protein
VDACSCASILRTVRLLLPLTVSRQISYLRPCDLCLSNRPSALLGCIPSRIIKDCSYICILLLTYIFNLTVNVALATGWTTRRSRFYSRQRRKDFSSSLCVQTGAGAHPDSCTVGTGGGGFRCPGRKRGRDVSLSTHPHLVPRSRMSRSYTSPPPKRFRGL